MKRRWIIWVPALLASHAALYFLAPHGGSVDSAAGGVASPAAAGAMTAAAKSHDRGPDTHTSGGTASSQLERMVGALLASKDLTKEQKQDALRELMRDWIRRDLRTALDLVFSPATRSRYGDMLPGYAQPELVKEEMLRHPDEVWEWIRSGRYGFARRDVTELWTKALLAAGQREPAMAAVATASPIEQHDLFVALCAGAGTEDLKSLRTMLEGPVAENSNLSSLMDYYAKRMAAVSDGDLKVLLGNEQNPYLREALCQQWVSRDLASLSPDQMASRLTGLPEDLRGKALRQLLGDAQLQDLPSIAGLMNATGSSSLWEQMEDDGAGGYRGQLVNLMDRIWNPYRPPHDLIGELNAVADPEQRTQVLMAAGTRWMQTRPEDYLEVARAIPVGPGRDAFIAGAATYGSLNDEEFAALTAAISDTAFRDRIIQEKKDAERRNADYFGPGPDFGK
ncbi:hypothetical protein [Haloferula sp. BvORR071]|uniref:hypothetical protein n=1 Tax=Haloferula sp. BvORR071 TaxID=1396141 RepID=UPI000552CC1E|nr:hypothetical protein [Haloferula sp. BvORR071]